MRRHIHVVATILVAASIVAACGSDSKKGSAAASGSAIASSHPAASGEPLRFGALCQESAPAVEVECYTATEAVFKQYNERGGLNGRPLELEHCDVGQSNPINLPNCIKKLTGDASILAFIGNDLDAGTAAAIEPLDMANIGSLMLSPDATTSPNAFPWAGWPIGVKAAARYLSSQGKTQPGVVFPPVEPGFAALNLIKSLYPAVAVGEVPAGISETDYTPFIARAREGGYDPLYVLSTAGSLVKMLEAADQLGYQTNIVVPYTCAHQTFISEVGANAKGVLCPVPYNLDAVGGYQSLMTTYGPKGFVTSYNGVNSYIAAKITIAALESIKGDITRRSVLDAMRVVKFNDPLLLEPIDFSHAGADPTFPRLASGLFNIYRFDGDHLVRASDKPVSAFG